MDSLKNIALVLVLLTVVLTNAREYEWHDEFANVDDDEGSNVYHNNDDQNKYKLFPDSPDGHHDPIKEHIHKYPKEIMYELENKDKKNRFQLFSYLQSPIADIMKQSLAINYFPKNAKDLFDCLRDNYPLPKGYTEPLDVYDYIIVGAGSGGSALASRLTEENHGAMVLVIEAGKPESLLSDVPMLVPFLSLSDYAWPYSTEPQPGICLGSEDQRCYWPRGRAVGGSSVINFMIYTRGRPEDWDRIANAGNYGWSYKEVLPYFINFQQSEVKKYKYEPYSGHFGDLTVENPPFRTGLVEAFLEAGRICGHRTLDYNAPDGFGFGYIQTTTIKGHRMSAAKAFLHPHKRRKNLHILTEARATKVLIDPHTKRAYGVDYMKNGVKHTARCRREVIVSAGPIASPQLLMLSGVGPKEHLESLGIPVIKDLRVGRTLYDHIAFPGVVFVLNTTNASILLPKVVTLPNLIQWLHFGEGLLASPGTVEGLGYLKTEVSNDPEMVPDIELLSMGASITLDSGLILRRAWRLTDEAYYTAFGSLSGLDTWSAIPLLLQPKSKGYLELRDTNPYSIPKMYPNYLTNRKDVDTMLAAIRYIIKLGNTAPFQKYGARLHLPEYPKCMVHYPGSDSYWECVLRTLLITIHHQISTCRMGPPSDPDAVVDPELRVYGIDGLRVVDSSVIPRSTSAHTNAPTMMIGVKAADLIKKTWAHHDEV